MISTQVQNPQQRVGLEHGLQHAIIVTHHSPLSILVIIFPAAVPRATIVRLLALGRCFVTAILLPVHFNFLLDEVLSVRAVLLRPSPGFFGNLLFDLDPIGATTASATFSISTSRSPTSFAIPRPTATAVS